MPSQPKKLIFELCWGSIASYWSGFIYLTVFKRCDKNMLWKWDRHFAKVLQNVLGHIRQPLSANFGIIFGQNVWSLPVNSVISFGIFYLTSGWLLGQFRTFFGLHPACHFWSFFGHFFEILMSLWDFFCVTFGKSNFLKNYR